MVRRLGILMAVWIAAVAVAVPVLAAPGIVVQTTRQGTGVIPVFAAPIFDRKGAAQPPLALPGQYFVVTGSGFPANTPLTATLNDGTKNVPLAPVDLLTPDAPATTPATDANGAIAGAAFRVPPAQQLAERNATFAVSAGPGAVVGVPVVVDIPLPGETDGDVRVIAFAAVFYLAAAAVVWLLVRRLPVFPRIAATQSDLIPGPSPPSGQR